VRYTIRSLLPGPLLVAGLALAWTLAQGRPAQPLAREARPAPPVSVLEAHSRAVRVALRAHGTVAAVTEGDLVPEVSGRVVFSALATGRFFEGGDVLLEIDPGDYERAAARARAALARATSEVALARSQLARLESLAAHEIANAAQLDEIRNAERVAVAVQELARLDLAHAREDLERTRLRAPYAGRVREKRIGVGQFAARGAPVARLYAIDAAEVRLPIPDRDLAFLDLPDGSDSDAPGPEVILRAHYAGQRREWHGRLVRSEGEIDPRSRMVHVVARVEDPYGRRTQREGPPLALGLFVEAEILGRELPDAFLLPRAALREGRRLAVVDGEDRLRFREVELVRTQGDEVIVLGGLEDGERVCLTWPATPVSGMRVRALAEDAGQLAGPPAAPAVLGP